MNSSAALQVVGEADEGREENILDHVFFALSDPIRRANHRHAGKPSNYSMPR